MAMTDERRDDPGRDGGAPSRGAAAPRILIVRVGDSRSDGEDGKQQERSS
jgi:hypothetical protein